MSRCIFSNILDVEKRKTMHDKGDLYEDKEMASNIRRYEAMKKSGVFTYFDVDEYLMIIDYYMQNDKQNKAVEACRIAQKVHGNNPELILKRAQIQVHQGKAQAALKAILPLEPLMSDNYEFYLTKASALLQTGDDDCFIEYFQKALDLSQDVDPDTREDIFFGIGEMLENGQLYEPALQFYKIASDEFPDNIDFLFKIGACYDCMNLPDRGLEAYNKAIDIDPFSETAWYNIGIMYNRTGDFDKAIEAYNFAIALDPSFADALFNKGNTYCNADMYKEALECYNEYLQEYPNSITVQCYIGECHFHLGQYDVAERCFDNVLQMFNDYADAWYGKAMVFSVRKENDKAIKSLKKALSINNEYDSAWIQLGRIYTETDQIGEAIKAYENAIELNKYDDTIWECLAIAYSSLDSIDIALEKLTVALDFMPDNSVLLYVKSAMEFSIGDTDSCIKDFRKAFRSNPELCEHFFNIVPKYRIPAEIKALCKKRKDNNK